MNWHDLTQTWKRIKIDCGNVFMITFLLCLVNLVLKYPDFWNHSPSLSFLLYFQQAPEHSVKLPPVSCLKCHYYPPLLLFPSSLPSLPFSFQPPSSSCSNLLPFLSLFKSVGFFLHADYVSARDERITRRWVTAPRFLTKHITSNYRESSSTVMQLWFGLMPTLSLWMAAMQSGHACERFLCYVSVEYSET